MSERNQVFLKAADLCEEYAFSLMDEKPEWAEVAMECARIIDDASKGALTIDEIGAGSCQEVPAFILKPEIDYGSGPDRK